MRTLITAILSASFACCSFGSAQALAPIGPSASSQPLDQIASLPPATLPPAHSELRFAGGNDLLALGTSCPAAHRTHSSSAFALRRPVSLQDSISPAHSTLQSQHVRLQI